MSHYVVVIESDDDFLVASVPGLRGCHTQAKDMTTLLKRIKQAIKLCLKAEKDVSKPLKFVGIQEVEVAR